ncbi:MAG: hypothetical protein JNL20_05695 [Thauera sp.]|nr:hypothetical protein [Thauera sp.]
MLFLIRSDSSAPAAVRASVPQVPRSAQTIDRALLAQPAEWRCFPSAWHLAAWREEAGERLAPCVDCLPAYQARMVRLQRCRHPEAVFVEEAGELVGRLPTPVGLSRFGRQSDVDPDVSAFVVALACRVFGVDGVGFLIGISAASLPAYRNGNRTLPPSKFVALQGAVRAAARFATMRI